MVIDETAAVGLNLGIAGGFLAGVRMPTYSKESINSATQLVHERAIEELIARDKSSLRSALESGQRAGIQHRGCP